MSFDIVRTVQTIGPIQKRRQDLANQIALYTGDFVRIKWDGTFETFDYDTYESTGVYDNNGLRL